MMPWAALSKKRNLDINFSCKIKGLFVQVFFLVAIGGCSTTQVDKLHSTLTNFEASVVEINQAIAVIDATLAKNCVQAQAIGASLVPLVSQSKKASAALTGINAGLTAWCQDPPTDLTSAIKATAGIVSTGTAAYRAVLKGA